LKVLCNILHPIKKAILTLEAQTTTLADCYISLIRLAASIKLLPKNFNANFRQHCLKVMDARFDDFDNDAYTLAYLLHPKYHG
jgi:hypothetical protein